MLNDSPADQDSADEFAMQLRVFDVSVMLVDSGAELRDFGKLLLDARLEPLDGGQVLGDSSIVLVDDRSELGNGVFLGNELVGGLLGIGPVNRRAGWSETGS